VLAVGGRDGGRLVGCDIRWRFVSLSPYLYILTVDLGKICGE